MRFPLSLPSCTSHRLAILTGLAAMACSGPEVGDPLTGPLTLSVTRQAPDVWEKPAGTLSSSWGTATLTRGPQGIQARSKLPIPSS